MRQAAYFEDESAGADGEVAAGADRESDEEKVCIQFVFSLVWSDALLLSGQRF